MMFKQSYIFPITLTENSEACHRTLCLKGHESLVIFEPPCVVGHRIPTEETNYFEMCKSHLLLLLLLLMLLFLLLLLLLLFSFLYYYYFMKDEHFVISK